MNLLNTTLKLTTRIITTSPEVRPFPETYHNCHLIVLCVAYLQKRKHVLLPTIYLFDRFKTPQKHIELLSKRDKLPPKRAF
jgi:hypothetical protein